MTENALVGQGEADAVSLLELAGRLAAGLGPGSRRVAVAESCTGGWLAKVLTDLPGSSAWFDRGVVTYSNEAKSDLLGVSPSLIERDGAVSESVARAMAQGIAERSGVDLSVAITGIAGPGGGVSGKPVGTVWFAWYDATDLATLRLVFDGDRDAVRRQAVETALRGLVQRATAP